MESFLSHRVVNRCMMNTARTAFLIFACIASMLIRGLHLLTHFGQLNTSEFQFMLSAEITDTEQKESLWNTWYLMTFIIGVAFSITGLLHWIIWRIKNTYKRLPTGNIATMLVSLVCVKYSAMHSYQILLGRRNCWLYRVEHLSGNN